MKVWIKFLGTYEKHKSGDIVQVDEDVAKSLVHLKIAEIHKTESWVKFLKDHEKYKKDDVVQVAEEVAKHLVTLKIAEVTVPDLDSLVEKTVEGLGENISKTVEAAVSKAVETLSKKIGVKLSIPATALDHAEEGMRGFKSVGEFVHCLIRAGNKDNPSVDKRLLLEDAETKAATGLNTQDDVGAGFLIPETMAAGIWEYVIGPQELLPKTDRYTTAGNNLKINGFDENSRKDGYRDGGVQAYWLDEAEEYTRSQPKWRRIGFELHKLGVLIYATDEQLDDTPVNLGNVFTRKAGNAIKFKVNESFVWGSGVGKPTGVMNEQCLEEVAIETNQAADSIIHQNIVKMYHRMPPTLRSGAFWYMHPNVEEQLEYMSFKAVEKDNATATQIPIYLPANGISGNGYSTLRGKPIIPLEYMKDLGLKGDILFANFSQYATLTKVGAGIKSASSIHVRFLFDEQVFKFSFRIDGHALWPAALEDYNGTTKRSPFVTLAARDTTSSSSGL